MSAFADFQGRAEEVALLLDRVAPGWSPDRLDENAPTPQTPHDIANVLARASVVLLTSYFEGFLKDLTDEALDAVAVAGRPARALSQHLRGRALESHIKTLRTTSDPGALWECLDQLVTLGFAFRSGAAVDEALLPREEIKRSISSIEPQKINELLRALGDSDLNHGPMSVFGERLRGLKSVRDNAVHGNERDVPMLGYSDVVTYLDLLLKAGAALQQRVDGLVART